jgi:hypothetical protein
MKRTRLAHVGDALFLNRRVVLGVEIRDALLVAVVHAEDGSGADGGV